MDEDRIYAAFHKEPFRDKVIVDILNDENMETLSLYNVINNALDNPSAAESGVAFQAFLKATIDFKYDQYRDEVVAYLEEIDSEKAAEMVAGRYNG